MLRILGNRAAFFLSSLLAAAILIAPSADAQRKKAPAPAAAAPAPKKKPAKKHKKKAPAAPAATGAPAAAASPAEAETETEAEPMPETPPESGDKPKLAESEDKPVDADEGEKPKETDKGAKLPSLLDAELGMKGFQRHLAYRDDVRNVLPDYDLGGAPAIVLGVGVYPIRTATGSVAAGLTAGFENGFSLGTTYRDPQPGQDGTHATSYTAYSIGARVNFNFGTNTIGLGTEYGAQNYKVDLPPPERDNAQVPDVEYRFIRPMGVFRFGIANRLALLGSLGYIHIMSAGEIVSASYFRGAATSASGWDLNLGVGWAPFASMKGLELRPMLGYRHIGYTFNTDLMNTEDPYFASGASDNYLSFALLVGLRL